MRIKQVDNTRTTNFLKEIKSSSVTFRARESLKTDLFELINSAQYQEPPVLNTYKVDLINKIASRNFLHPEKPVVIGVTGESASGKTTLAQMVRSFAFDNGLSLSLIGCDNYYNDLSPYYKKYGNYPKALLAGENLECPDSFNLSQMRQDLMSLKNGKTVKIPQYSFSTGVSTPNALEVKPAKFILLEGIVANSKSLHNDINVYVDCPYDVQLSRAMERAAQRASDPEETKKMWKIICDSAKKHIVPLKKDADIVLNGNINLASFRDFLDNLLKIIKK